MYVKSKSTVTQSVSELVTRSPIEPFWTAKKKGEKTKKHEHVPPEQMFEFYIIRFS